MTKKISEGIFQLDDGMILNTHTQKLYSPDYLWIVEKDYKSMSIGGKIFPVINTLSDKDKLDKKWFGIYVYCSNSYEKGKTTFADLHDRYSSFQYPLKGGRYIDGNWIEFDHDIKPEKVYFLIFQKNEPYPANIEILKIKEIKKSIK